MLGALSRNPETELINIAIFLSLYRHWRSQYVKSTAEVLGEEDSDKLDVFHRIVYELEVYVPNLTYVFRLIYDRLFINPLIDFKSLTMPVEQFKSFLARARIVIPNNYLDTFYAALDKVKIIKGDTVDLALLRSLTLFLSDSRSDLSREESLKTPLQSKQFNILRTQWESIERVLLEQVLLHSKKSISMGMFGWALKLCGIIISADDLIDMWFTLVTVAQDVNIDPVEPTKPHGFHSHTHTRDGTTDDLISLVKLCALLKPVSVDTEMLAHNVGSLSLRRDIPAPSLRKFHPQHPSNSSARFKQHSSQFLYLDRDDQPHLPVQPHKIDASILPPPPPTPQPPVSTALPWHRNEKSEMSNIYKRVHAAVARLPLSVQQRFVETLARLSRNTLTAGGLHSGLDVSGSSRGRGRFATSSLSDDGANTSSSISVDQCVDRVTSPSLPGCRLSRAALVAALKTIGVRLSPTEAEELLREGRSGGLWDALDVFEFAKWIGLEAITNTSSDAANPNRAVGQVQRKQQIDDDNQSVARCNDPVAEHDEDGDDRGDGVGDDRGDGREENEKISVPADRTYLLSGQQSTRSRLGYSQSLGATLAGGRHSAAIGDESMEEFKEMEMQLTSPTQRLRHVGGSHSRSLDNSTLPPGSVYTADGAGDSLQLSQKLRDDDQRITCPHDSYLHDARDIREVRDQSTSYRDYDCSHSQVGKEPIQSTQAPDNLFAHVARQRIARKVSDGSAMSALLTGEASRAHADPPVRTSSSSRQRYMHESSLAPLLSMAEPVLSGDCEGREGAGGSEGSRMRRSEPGLGERGGGEGEASGWELRDSELFSAVIDLLQHCRAAIALIFRRYLGQGHRMVDNSIRCSDLATALCQPPINLPISQASAWRLVCDMVQCKYDSDSDSTHIIFSDVTRYLDACSDVGLVQRQILHSIKAKVHDSSELRGDRLRLFAATPRLRMKLRGQRGKGRDSHTWTACPDHCSLQELKALMSSIDIVLTNAEVAYLADHADRGAGFVSDPQNQTQAESLSYGGGRGGGGGADVSCEPGARIGAVIQWLGSLLS